MIVMGTINSALVADQFLASFTKIDKRTLMMNTVAKMDRRITQEEVKWEGSMRRQIWFHL